MPVYSKTIEDKKIINLVKDKYQNVLILGCGACMNESLAYTNDTPIYDNSKPYSIERELQRVANILSQFCLKVKWNVIPEGSNTLCMRKIDSSSFVLEEQPDVILILCCPSGQFGLKSNVTNVPIIGISKPFGFLSYAYIEDGTKKVMVKDKSKVITNNYANE
jgi:hypothetical protein